ncbi:hypothetical protein [Sphaerisporangium dianthi]|uniref:Uncharacterized protein n=1 Tax=Sphaerisporangium dianthi TaxID=1436120 RepID=A0ABV9C7S3_9ACTN
MADATTAAIAAGEQAALFALDPSADGPVSGVPYLGADPAVSDAALVGDGYGWLAAALPAPAAPPCPDCTLPQILPASAPVLWTCPRCHPLEAR